MNSSQDGNRTILATFISLFLGRVDELISLMQERFPELELVKEDCIETTWVESILLLGQLPNDTLDILLERSFRSPFFKSKSDYVKKPMPEIAFQGIWSQLLEEEGRTGTLNFVSYGGKMDEISETATPFPHRIGNLYKIIYIVAWQEEDNMESQIYISWIRKLYSYMSAFVSKSPREAYVNYRYLDIGMNDDGNTSYVQASVFGRKYFKKNFDRLVYVKTKTAPENFFKHEQSLSYVTEVPFVVVDLVHFRSVDIDVKNKIAWVQSGATLGIDGYFSGEGYGFLFQKYGLAVDNIIDAHLSMLMEELLTEIPWENICFGPFEEVDGVVLESSGMESKAGFCSSNCDGLSYVSKVPFVIVDLVNFRTVDVDVENKVAWVQSGAILGELYYKITEKSTILTFPAGVCHTVGIGGYFSGGGWGPLFRKYGLAADNIIDA
ncbi:hypothetical protein CRYUN_Cryun40dG0069600 [Craigia yunnanensis]